MSNLQQLARKKSDAEVFSHVAALPARIRAIQNELSPKGLLRSGAMLRRVLSASETALHSAAVDVSNHFSWAATHALLASQSWIEVLIVDSQLALEPLTLVARVHIKEAADLSGQPELAERLLFDFADATRREKEFIALTLRSKLAERQRGLLKGFPSLIFKLFGRFFGGGSA